MTSGMRRGWLAVTAVSFLLCLFVAWQARDLSLIDRLGPGPGFFPFWLSLIGAVLSVVIFFQTSRLAVTPGATPDEALVFPRDREALLRLVAIVGLTAIGASLMLPLGYRLAVLLLVIALLLVLGARRWWVILFVALAASFGAYQVFNNWLDVILPQGWPERLMQGG